MLFPESAVLRGPLGPIGLGLGVHVADTLLVGVSLFDVALILFFDPDPGGSKEGGALSFFRLYPAEDFGNPVFARLGLELGGGVLAA